MTDVVIWVSALAVVLAATLVVVRLLTRRHDPAPVDPTVGVHTELARGESAGPPAF